MRTDGKGVLCHVSSASSASFISRPLRLGQRLPTAPLALSITYNIVAYRSTVQKPTPTRAGRRVLRSRPEPHQQIVLVVQGACFNPHSYSNRLAACGKQ
jgi:hypothetical protein